MLGSICLVRVMIKKILKSKAILWFFPFYLILLTCSIEADEQQFVLINLLNKTSAKKHPVEIPIGSAYVIRDIRIVPRSCQVIEDEVYKTKTARAIIDVYMEQDLADDKNQADEEPILLYRGELTNNSRIPSTPLEHPIYDLMLVGCR